MPGRWKCLLLGLVALLVGPCACAAEIGAPFFYLYPPALTAGQPFVLKMGRTGNADALPLAATRLYVSDIGAAPATTRTVDGARVGTTGFQVLYTMTLPAGTYRLAYYDTPSPDLALPPDAVATIGVTTEGFIRVIEYVNASSGHFFITADAEEIRKLDSGEIAGWSRTGEWFKAIPGQQDTLGVAHVCRLYGLPQAGLDTHFFSDDAAECEGTLAKWPGRWVQESASAFGLPPDYGCDGFTEQPIYRLYNNRPDANHRYTIHWQTRDTMVAAGWIEEVRHDDPTIGGWSCTLR
ncbi:MAG: hypothetical protein U1F10_04845 [Burkholderiales bacterium]